MDVSRNVTRNSRTRNRRRVPEQLKAKPPALPGHVNYIYTRSDKNNLEASLIATPDWFSANAVETFDVSIIVPMFRSAVEIFKQIESWDGVVCDGISKEVIYVDDCCPDDSSSWVIKSWENYRNRWNGMRSVCGNYSGHIGKIVKINHNVGYASACNTGASFARGKYLIFLHPDVLVTAGWLSPIFDTLRAADNVGMVGNLQLHEDGTIDSAGREWHWDSMCFEDIGRDVFNGKRLDRIVYPEDIFPGVEEREAISGCCMAIPKDIFNKVGGFDTDYRFAYWEDVDLSMKVREAGHKIYFQPQSVVYHKGFHAEANLHPFMSENFNLFKNKWINNDKISQFVRKRENEIQSIAR